MLSKTLKKLVTHTALECLAVQIRSTADVVKAQPPVLTGFDKNNPKHVEAQEELIKAINSYIAPLIDTLAYLGDTDYD